MAARAVDSDAQLPAQDLQVQHTLSCPFAHKETAQAALEQLPQVFSVRQQVCAPPSFSQNKPLHSWQRILWP